MELFMKFKTKESSFAWRSVSVRKHSKEVAPKQGEALEALPQAPIPTMTSFLDDFDDPGLIDAQMKFANAFDINLSSQLR
nr:hypothetical protein [Tanacetum cinerariifolium]